MAISFVGQASAATTSVTLPTHNVGDYIIIFAYRTATTAPTLPAGYTNITTGSANANSYRVGYKIATGSDTSGTWTNATEVLSVVYGGLSGIGASASQTNAASTTTTIPALTMTNTSGTSWVIAFAGSKQAISMSTPTGTTLRGSQAGTAAFGIGVDTNGTVSSWASHTSTNGSSVTSCGAAIELVVTASFSTFSDPFNTGSQDTSLWGGNFGTLSWAPQFTITNPIAYTGYGGMATKSLYDLTGTAVYTSMASVGDQTLASLETIPLEVADVSQVNKLFWYVNGGILAAFKTIAGVQTQITSTTYNSSVHIWFKIRESGGTVFFDYSTDGVSYTNFTSLANPFAVTALLVLPSLGTYASEASATAAVWNSFNTPPAAPTLGHATFSMMGVG